MKQKIISGIILFLFFVTFGYIYGDEYWNFQKIQQEKNNFSIKNKQILEEYSLQTLPLLGEHTELFVTPDLSLLDQIVREIDMAQEKIYVEIYIFTEKRMREALIEAHRRGVEVKVLLENNPYQSPYLNDDTFEILQQAGVAVVWSDPLNYSLNHSKLLLIDQKAYISTGNFSYSLFKNNRDFLISLKNPELGEQLEQLFLMDYTHKLAGVLHENLVISPYNSREKIEGLLIQAHTSIDFYFPYIQDQGLEEILFTKASQGVKIRGIVEKEFYKENSQLVENYKKQGITLFPLLGAKLHAKMILVDETYMYVGSINFSKYSMDENREIGIILQDTTLVTQMGQIFISDL